MADFAVVFDLDGTLIDTEKVWDDVRRELAAEDGIPWPEAATTAMMGMSTPEWSSYMTQQVGLKGDAQKRVIDGMLAHYHRGLDILPGAPEAVRRMGAIAPLAIASSSPRVLIEAAVEEMGLSDLFTVTVSTEEVAAGKPAPDGYLAACEKLGVLPQHAVAVEDSGNGITSALSAGMKVIAIPPHFHPPTPEVLARADAVIDNLDQLTVELVNGLRSTSAR